MSAIAIEDGEDEVDGEEQQLAGTYKCHAMLHGVPDVTVMRLGGAWSSRSRSSQPFLELRSSIA